MSVISTNKATERLSKRLQRAGLALWVARSSGDAWGTYLFFQVGGRCVGGAGWTLREATAHVDHLIAYADYDEAPPFDWCG